MTNTSTSSENSQGDDQNLQAQGAASTSQGETSSGQSTQQFTHEELEQRYQELKRDNANYRERLKKLDTQTAQATHAAKLAEEARLKEQGEFKELAEKHEARVKELEPQIESYTKLALQLQSQIELDIKEWPEEVKAFDPGKDVPVEQRLAWVQKSKPLLEKLQAQTTQARPIGGNRPNPPALNNPAAADTTKYTQNLIRSGKYGA